MSTVYQKYRPRNFKEIVNQNYIKIILQNEIEAGNMVHAYLFCGPRGTGKTTMARVVTKSLNCDKREKGESEPCNSCESCERINKGTSLDIIEIDAASHTGVDNVRENIIASARVSVAPEKHKIFIIDEAHMLSAAAFNALLKTLEEPPLRVIFILCTTEVHKMPTTIISRCQRFDFKRISAVDVVKKLEYIAEKEEIKIEKSILESIARQSEGHMRDAESLLGQIISIGGKNITKEEAELVIPKSNLNLVVNFIEFLDKKDNAGAVRLINNLVYEGVDLKQFCIDLIETLRKMLLVKINPELAEKFSLDLGSVLEERIEPLIQKNELNRIAKMITEFQESKNNLAKSFISQLPLEMAAVSLCAPEKGAGARISTYPKNYSAGNKNKGDEAESSFKKVNLSLAQIKDKWSEVLIRIKKYNHSLSFVLRVCEPRNISGNQLCLAFKYRFHKDKVEQAGMKSLIEKVLREVYNSYIELSATLDDTLVVSNDKASFSEEKKEKEGGEQAVNDVLRIFGGKMVK